MSAAPRIVAVARTGNPFSDSTLDGRRPGSHGYASGTLIDLIQSRAAADPSATAIVEIGGDRITYGALLERSSRIAGGLRERHHVQPGDRVAIRHRAGAEWALAFWATILAGAIPVAVNTRFAPPEIEHVLADSGAVLDLRDGSPLPEGAPYLSAERTADDIAALFYTSGTTGRPKGVPTTHAAFLANAENLTRCLRIPRTAGRDFRTLISVPLFHVTGCNSQFLAAAYVGGTSVIMPAFDLAGLAHAIPAERITFLVTVPAVYNLLLRSGHLAGTDTSAVRWVAYGGAPIPTGLVKEIIAAFPAARVINGYGMTETASLLTVLPHDDAADHSDSVGYAVPSVELAIDETSPGVGELLARGTNVMKGYWGTAEPGTAFVEGWLRTGDVVRVDQAGRIHIVDRAKDLINRGGEKISSVEVEDVLSSAPGVVETAVIAVPDDVMGEKVGAVVVTDGPLDLSAVLGHCQAQLADFKIPQYFALRDTALPRNAAGKLLKAELRAGAVWSDSAP